MPAASDDAAPSANARSNTALRALAPSTAAPVRINPRIGPSARRPQKPGRNPQQQRLADARGRATVWVTLRPTARKGRDKNSAMPGNRSANPSPRKSRSLYSARIGFARPIQEPASAATVATPANVIAMPTSIGSPLRRNGWSRAQKQTEAPVRCTGSRSSGRRQRRQ